MPSLIPAALIAAYRETDYRTGGKTPFILRIGVANAALLAMQAHHAVTCSAFVTTCNPHSRRVPEACNNRRQAALCEQLTVRGLPFSDGIGQHPDRSWPGEASFLIYGLPCDEAQALGRRWQQNAVVWNGGDAVPQLILLR